MRRWVPAGVAVALTWGLEGLAAASGVRLSPVLIVLVPVVAVAVTVLATTPVAPPAFPLTRVPHAPRPPVDRRLAALTRRPGAPEPGASRPHGNRRPDPAKEA